MKSFPRLYGLVISAGTSQRMGKFKPLLHYQGVPFLINILAKMSTVCQKIRVVTGFRHEEIAETISRFFHQPSPSFWKSAGFSEAEWRDIFPRVQTVYNKNYRLGMFSSLQSGIRNIVDADWILYHFVDQPHLPFSFYRELTDQIRPEMNWIQPTFRGKKGHPILLHQQLIPDLLNFPTNRSLAQFLQYFHPRQYVWKCSYPQILQDVDTPEDYQRINE